MRKTKRTVSETETHRVITVHGRLMRIFCKGCGREVDMIEIEPAAEALHLGIAELSQRLAKSRGHSTEVGGLLWVCRAWLSQPP